MSRYHLSACLAAGLVLSAPALAQETVFWGEIGDWDIEVDTTISNGCYAVAEWQSGTIVRIGINPETDFYYVLIGNPRWAPIAPEREYALSVQFDSRPAWDVTATGLQFNPGELVYYYAQTQQFDFIEEFMRLNRMKISAGPRTLDTLVLRGSRAAFEGVMKCQDEMARLPPPPPAPPAGGRIRTGPGKAAQF